MSGTPAQNVDHIRDNAVLHVFDLPQLHTRPSAAALLQALDLLQKTSNNFDGFTDDSKESTDRLKIDPTEAARYLTSIISSPLVWLNPEEAETIWDLASLRLSERAGRTAAPSIDRSFRISDVLTVTLHEPSLTEDHLGLKTWTSSLLLAKRLPLLTKHIPNGRPRVLELGSGTGLVGLAAAFTWYDHVSEVMLTDLPEIVPNLRRNIEGNLNSLQQNHDKLESFTINHRVLDWADENDLPSNGNPRYPVIIAADPIYSSEHPKLLVDTVRRWLEVSTKSRFMVELPLRDGYSKDRADLLERLHEFMDIVEEGEDIGYDDWEGKDGQPVQVICWWAVWKLRGYAQI